MPDPKFELYAGSTKIQENNDWAPATGAAFTAVSAFPFPANSRDAAGVYELDAGRGYTIHVSSNNGQGGVVMFEVYDLGNVTGASKFTNIAVRGPTGTDEATLILGFYVDGDPASKMTLLTRGVGPKLVAFDPNIVPIPDPKVELFDSGQRIIMTNDNWTGADFVGEMLQATDFVGAFALDGGSADAESLALLSPGGYTMQVLAGSGATSGEAIVELYEVP